MKTASFPAESAAARLNATSRHWSRLKISLLWIYRGGVLPSVSRYRDPFPTMTAWLVLKGAVVVTIGSRRDSARSGEWLFPKPVPRIHEFSPGAEILSVRFRIEWPDGSQLFDDGLGVTLKARENPELERAARRLERMVESLTQMRFHDASFTERNLDFLQFLQLEKAVHVWSESVYRALIKAGLSPRLQQAGDPRVEAILERLDAWPLEEPFRAAELARRSGFSRANLERILIKAVGSSSKGYLERRRIHHALQRLRNQAIPVKQIAIETGFRHASSFCAWFKQKSGSYPGEMTDRIF